MDCTDLADSYQVGQIIFPVIHDTQWIPSSAIINVICGRILKVGRYRASRFYTGRSDTDWSVMTLSCMCVDMTIEVWVAP